MSARYMDYGCEYSRRRIMLEPSNDRPAMVVTSTAAKEAEWQETVRVQNFPPYSRLEKI